MAQRLVRRLCEHCKKPYQPPAELLARLGVTLADIKGITIYQAQGCEECLNTGYRGRLAIFEVMDMTDGIARLAMERADTNVIRQQAIKDGMILLIQDGFEKVKKGITTIDEVLSVAAIEHAIVE
jgi:type II secretory ATPase GspE/PulE/Tfp pilus assembly ATPase PilB-like protein